MKILVNNKKAKFNYFLEQSFETGIVLTGTEVKSLSKAQGNLDQAYIMIKKNEVWILNLFIAPYDHGNIFNVDPTRTRKLLLHKKEIIKIIYLQQTQKYLIIPKKIYFKKDKIKVEIALAKPKKLYDKREDLKQRILERSIKKGEF